MRGITGGKLHRLLSEKENTVSDTYTFKEEVHMRSLVNKKSDRVMVNCNL